MRLGAVLPSAADLSPGAYVRIAQHVEALGLHSLWVTDHVAVPADIRSRYPFSRSGEANLPPTAPWHDSLTLLTFLAAHTSTVRLGTAVIPVITRDPITLASQSATADALSGGRLELGLGSGWLVEEAQALGRRADRRVRRLVETIDILRLAWTEPTFSYRGELYDVPTVGVHPQPAQRPVPMWIGGHGAAAVRTATSRGTGLVAWLPRLETMRDLAERAWAQRPGTPLAATVRVRPDRFEEDLERVKSLDDLGVELVLLLLQADVDERPAELEHVVDHLERVMESAR